MEFKSGILQFEPEKGIEPENCTEEYRKLMNLIRDGEGEIMIREFGMGLNEGMAKDKTVQDIFAFERYRLYDTINTQTRDRDETNFVFVCYCPFFSVNTGCMYHLAGNTMYTQQKEYPRKRHVFILMCLFP